MAASWPLKTAIFGSSRRAFGYEDSASLDGCPFSPDFGRFVVKLRLYHVVLVAHGRKVVSVGWLHIQESVHSVCDMYRHGCRGIVIDV